MYDYCLANCQFCYKVNEIRLEEKEEKRFLDKIDIALSYLNSNTEIDNVLMSGGDPAAMPVTILIECINKIITESPVRIVRFATKVLTYNPHYFQNPLLLEFLRSLKKLERKQVIIVAQINHPAEISNEVKMTLKELQAIGIQVRGQPAIIKGVNDDVETLIQLYKKLSENQISMYYLTSFMPVRGVEQYALKLHDVYKNVQEARSRLNGLEKHGVLLTSHDFGKFEICGFIPNVTNPEKIVLRWHQSAMQQYLPDELVNKVPTKVGDLLVLNYNKEDIYCIDHLFKFNNLPYFNELNNIIIK